MKQFNTNNSQVTHTHTHTSKSTFKRPIVIGAYLLGLFLALWGCSEVMKADFSTTEEKSRHKYWKEADDIAQQWTNELEYFSTQVNPFAFKADRKKEIERVLISQAQSQISDPTALSVEVTNIKGKMSALKPCTPEEYKTSLTNRMTSIANSLNAKQSKHLEDMISWLITTDSSTTLQQIITHLENDEANAMEDLSMEESKTVLLISRMMIRGISYFAEHQDKWEAIFNGEVIAKQMGFVPVFLLKVVKAVVAVVVAVAVVAAAAVLVTVAPPVGAFFIAGAVVGGVSRAIERNKMCRRYRNDCFWDTVGEGVVGSLTYGSHGLEAFE